MIKRSYLCVLAALLGVGCSDGDESPAVDSGNPFVDAGLDSTVEPEGDSGPDEFDSATMVDGGLCPVLAQRTTVPVPVGVLPDDMLTWTCENRYILNGPVVVYSEDPSTPQVLTIEPGVVVQGVRGDESTPPGILLVTRTGRLEAIGTPDYPIVFTSIENQGSRDRGDWGGITMAGRAGRARDIEGFDPEYEINGVPMATYLEYGPLDSTMPDGGIDAGVDDAGLLDAATLDAGIADAEVLDAEVLDGSVDSSLSMADMAWNCGRLEYVRVEFASYDYASGSETNAVQLYSCGYDTLLDHVQSHRSGDDGFEIFGGFPRLSHIVATGASDEQIDWDDGFAGRMQFVVGQKYADADSTGDGVEAGSSGDQEPEFGRPRPRIFNVTLIGTNGMGSNAAKGLILRGGHEGYLRNVIIAGFNGGYVDIGGTPTIENVTATPARLTLRNSIFFRGMAAADWPTDSDSLNEAMFFAQPSELNQVGVDPMLTMPWSENAPNFVPMVGGPTGMANAEAPSEAEGELGPAFFDTGAQYVGAFEPGGTNWMAGWTTAVED